MNKEEIEFNNNQLEQILNELRDIENYKGFKDGAWKYELGYYQGLLIVDKINQLQERINQAIEYINQESAFLNDDEYELFNKKELLEILKGENNE
jgi:hypothetical protein